MNKEKDKKSYEIDMCHGPLMSQLITFSIPLILASNLQLLFNAVDIIVVGKFSGSQALAAVGATTALINLTLNLMTGISLGTSVIAGRFFASDDKRGMRRIVHTSMNFALWGGIVFALLGIFFSGYGLRLMGTPESIMPQAMLYIRVYFLGLPFFMLYTYGAAVLRAVGDTKRPLYFLVAAGVINAILNVILVVLFRLGVLGVAVATSFSQLVSCVLVIRCMVKTEGSYRLYFSRLSFDPVCMKQIIKIGLPAGIQSLVINFSNVLLQSSVNTFGEIAIAGYTAANNIFGFMYVTSNSFTQACMCFMSQNYGAGRWKRMKMVLIDCFVLSVGIMIVLGGGVYYFGEEILSIYTASPDVVKCGMEIFLYTTTTYCIFSIMDLLPGAMRGVGFSAVPMILSIIGTVGVRIYWIYWQFPYHHALDFLFISYPLSWVVTVAMQIIYGYFVLVKLNKFRRKIGITRV